MTSFDSSDLVELEIIQVTNIPNMEISIGIVRLVWLLLVSWWEMLKALHDHEVISDDPHAHIYCCMIFNPNQVTTTRDVSCWTTEIFVIIGQSYQDFWHRFYTVPGDTITHAALVDLVGPTVIRRRIVPSFINDLTQSSQKYHISNHVSIASHFGWTIAVYTSSTIDRYVNIFQPSCTRSISRSHPDIIWWLHDK